MAHNALWVRSRRGEYWCPYTSFPFSLLLVWAPATILPQLEFRDQENKKKKKPDSLEWCGDHRAEATAKSFYPLRGPHKRLHSHQEARQLRRIKRAIGLGAGRYRCSYPLRPAYKRLLLHRVVVRTPGLHIGFFTLLHWEHFAL